ncbi:O-antigen ligase family protein [bacterium]|nr:O-antigen ligase family protein [bacterium]
MEKDNKNFLKNLFLWLIPFLLMAVALDHGGSTLFAKDLITITLWGLGLMMLLGMRKIPIPPKWIYLLWLAFWIWGILTIFTSWSPDRTMGWTLHIGGFLVFGLFSYALAEEAIENFFRMFFAGAMVIVLIGYFFIVGARTGLFIGRHDMMLHFISTFFWKNPAAGYLILLIPPAFALFLTDVRKGWRIFYLIFTLLSSGALLLTRSRAAWLSFIIAVILSIPFVIPFLKRIWRYIIIFPIAAVIIAFIVMPPSWVIGRVEQISEVAKEKPEEPIEERRMMLDMGWRMIKDNPVLGLGMDAFIVAYPVYLESSHYLSSHLHNQYLQYAAEGGIIAALLFAAAILSTIFFILKGARRKKDLLLAGIGVGTLAYAIHIGFDFDWQFWGTTLPFIAFLGIGIRNSMKAETRAISSSKKVFPILITALGFTAAILTSAAATYFDKYQSETDFKRQLHLLDICTWLNPLSARYYYEKAQIFTSRGDRENALKNIDKAHSLEPDNPIFLYSYGFLLWNVDTAKAIEYLEKAVERIPYIFPELQLNFAQKLRDAHRQELAEKVLTKILKNFPQTEHSRYTDKTASHRYIVARAMNDLAQIYLERDDFYTADSIYRESHILGCPRYWDALAKIWGMDIMSPEQTVAEMLDAINTGDTIRAWSFLADSAQVKLPPNTQIYLAQIMNVKQNMLKEKASVDVLMLKIDGEKYHWTMEFFDLFLTEDGWKIFIKF